jgi:hypothetical protein
MHGYLVINYLNEIMDVRRYLVLYSGMSDLPTQPDACTANALSHLQRCHQGLDSQV